MSEDIIVTRIEAENAADSLPTDANRVAKRLELSASPEAKKRLLKRRHDIQGSVNMLKQGLEAIEDGYRFDDERGPAKLQALRKSLGILEEEMRFLIELLKV